MLHGLVAVRFHGAWHRQDPRGNKPGVEARFSLTGERLASSPTRPPGKRTTPCSTSGRIRRCSPR